MRHSWYIAAEESYDTATTSKGKTPATRSTPVIGVAGGTASGKTTVVQAILDRVGGGCMAHTQHGSYYRDPSYLPLKARRRLHFDHPNALDTPLLIQRSRWSTTVQLEPVRPKH